MSKYEMVFLFAPDTSEERRTELCERMKGYVTQMNGVLDILELWEKRRLAYQIRKFREAFYYVFRFQGDGKLVDELEKRMRVTDEIIRFLTVRKDEEDKVAEKRVRFYAKKREGLEKRRKREPLSNDRGDGTPSHHRDRDRDRGRPRVDGEVKSHE